MISTTDEAEHANARLSARIEDLRIELAAARERVIELERLADTDPLLPLPNRRAFLRGVDHAIRRTERYGTPAAVLFVDVDGLKSINDAHGHSSGDAVLLHVGRVLLANLRAADLIARIGGDEFGLVLDFLHVDAAHAKARQLVDAIASASLDLGRTQLRIGITAGLAMIAPGDTGEHVLARADRAMYAQRSAR